MLSFFRRVSKSKIGTGIMALVLVAILAGFAVADLTNFGSGQIKLEVTNEDRQYIDLIVPDPKTSPSPEE